MHIFTPDQALRVFDMTSDKNVELFRSIAESCGIPAQFVNMFASTNVGANKNMEDDFFALMQCLDVRVGVHGFYRETDSSTLGKVAGEYDIYRSFVPSHIQ